MMSWRRWAAMKQTNVSATAAGSGALTRPDGRLWGSDGGFRPSPGLRCHTSDCRIYMSVQEKAEVEMEDVEEEEDDARPHRQQDVTVIKPAE